MSFQLQVNHVLLAKHLTMVLISIGFGMALGTGGLSRALAFSPYESYLLSGQDTRVGLIAKALPGRETEVRTLLADLEQATQRELLSQAGIRQLASFSRQIKSTTYILQYFEFAGNKQYLHAVKTFEAATPEIAKLSKLVSPVGDESVDAHWTQMEWISFIRGKNVDEPARQKLSMVTTLRPEKELEYRTMHQTVWPGVVDQMILRNNRNCSVFLCDMEGEIFEFIYVEYVGSDAKRDKDLNQLNPINRRWWKITDECQKPIPGENSVWSNLELISADK